MASINAPFKTAIIKKTIAARILARPLGIFFLIEYPKSGGTWLKNMLAMSLGIPAWTRDQSPFQSCIMQAHWIKSTGLPLNHTVVMHRDGRDVMVSFYYHSYFYNDLLNAAHVDLMKKLLPFDDYDDIESNLLPFMKFVFETPASPTFSWTQFVNTWHQKPDVVSVKYEDLRKDTCGELARVLTLIEPQREWSTEFTSQVAEAFTMKNMQRKQAELNKGIHGRQNAEKPFIRQGSLGGWSRHFSDEALAWFGERAGDELMKLGYSLDRPEIRQSTLHS